MTHAETRFRDLWTRCGGQDAAAVWQDLAAHYAEPARHYHTLAHIWRCVRAFDTVRGQIEEPEVVELALWTHDVIYVPGACNNEASSADWLLARAGGHIPIAARVVECILATTHRVAPPHAAAAWTVDIDIAGLGVAWAQFCCDGARLRQERPDLCDIACCEGERAFLEMLLARPAIYYTPYFRSRCEARARANLARRIEILAAATS